MYLIFRQFLLELLSLSQSEYTERNQNIMFNIKIEIQIT